MPQFDFAVVGKGLMGAAAARHLSAEAGRVVLIGPDEPVDAKTHTGVYASHYDEGRITRTVDPNPVWAGLAHASIARYRAIERQSGTGFFTEIGCLLAGQSTGNGAVYVGGARKNAIHFGLNIEDHDRASLNDRFPFFEFSDGVDGLFEKDGAGHVSPRKLVDAQTECARLNGATVINHAVKAIRHRSDHGEIETMDGDRITASKVIVATGGYSIMKGLFPDPLDVTVEARTVTLFELAAKEARRLTSMPSMIYEHEDPTKGIYLLPPILYPDGKHYLKIGADPIEGQFQDERQLGEWFRSDGTPHASEFQVEAARTYVPEVRFVSTRPVPCITTHTVTGYPYVGWSDSRFIGVLNGGCGAAAKSSDEIGRLGAMLALHGSVHDQGHAADFEPRFR